MFNPESLVDFFVESNQLKTTTRYSSCLKEVQESSAGHSWHVVFMVLVIAGELRLSLDIPHAMKLAAVHDLGEYALQQDFDSYLVATGVLSKTEKDRVEELAMAGFRERFDFGKRLYSLWEEYQRCKTPEARYVKALDKLESHFHVIQRGVCGDGSGDARHQALYADSAVRDFPQLEPLLRATKIKLRPILEKQGLIWKPEYNYPD